MSSAELSAINMASSTCQTLGQVKVVNVAYAWKIPEFFKLYENAEAEKPPVLESPVFSAESDAPLKWRLRLSLNDEDTKFMSASLQLVSSGPNCRLMLRAKFRLSVFDRFNGHRYKYLGESNFVEGVSAKVSRFVNGFTLIADKDDVLPDGALTIMCLINTGAGYCKDDDIFDDRLRVTHDLQDLLNDRSYTDIKFTVFGKEFRAHKCILLVRCPLFLHVLEERIERTGNRCVYNPPSELTDIEPVVMEEALRFIYTGKVGDIYEHSIGLLNFAEKYNLPQLKDMSENAIIDSIDCTTAAYYYLVGDKKNAENLKKAAMDFIIEHRAEVMHTPTFKFLQEKREDLVDEIFRNAVLRVKTDEIVNKLRIDD